MTSALAASYSVSFSMSTGTSGNAYVNGYTNGKTYSLSAGTATLRMYDDYGCYSGGEYYMTLYKYTWVGLGTKIGTMTATNTGYGASHWVYPKFCVNTI